MNATLICQTPAQLEHLRTLAAAEGLQVLQSLTRDAATALAPLLADAQGDLLVVDCPAASLEQDLAAIEAATRQHPGLVVLMLSASREAEALLAAMRAGVREVLPAQPQPGEFAAALRRIALHARGPSAAPPRQGRTIAFVACKGGSGATFLATNVAYALATEHHARILLLDLDLQYGDAAYFVSESAGRASVADVARQAERLDATLLQASTVQVAPGYRLLPAPEEPDAAMGITPPQLQRLLQVAREAADFVVLDVERLLDPLSVRALDGAELIYLVTENMVPHARDAKRLVRILRALGYADAKLRLVVNKFQRHGIDLAQVEEVVGLKVAHVLHDGGTDAAEAVNTGVAVLELHPRSAIAREVREIAAALAGPGRHPQGWFARLVGEAA